MAAEHLNRNGAATMVAVIWGQLDSLIERIPECGCWIWTGAVANSRYGSVRFFGKTWLAHRLIYELLTGPIPKGLEVCHRCDIGVCVNPNHLFVGTHADNMQDAVSKGRISTPKISGDRHYMTIIPDAIAEEIGRRHAAGQRPLDIANDLGASYIRTRDITTHKRRAAYVRGAKAYRDSLSTAG